jgi:hypothetical protein
MSADKAMPPQGDVSIAAGRTDSSPAPATAYPDPEGLTDETRESIKQQLMLHLAGSTLDTGSRMLERLFSALITISGVFLSAYLAILNYLKPASEGALFVCQFVPAIFWIVSIAVLVAFSIPRKKFFDLKDLAGIISAGVDSTRRQWRVVLFASWMTLLGIVLAFAILSAIHAAQLAPAAPAAAVKSSK